MALKTLKFIEENSIETENYYSLQFNKEEDKLAFCENILQLSEEEELVENYIYFDIPKEDIVTFKIDCVIYNKTYDTKENEVFKGEFEYVYLKNKKGNISLKISGIFYGDSSSIEIKDVFYGDRKKSKFSTKEKIDFCFGEIITKKFKYE